MSKYTKVKNYSTEQLLNRVKSLNSYNGLPNGYWILGVRSKADTYDVFDDKFYIFKGDTFIDVMTGTTNSGGYGLMNFIKWNKRGTAVVKADEWYYDVWRRGKHYGSSGSVVALRQDDRYFKLFRDNNKNKKSGDVKLWSLEKNTGINFHPNTYNINNKIIKWTIGGWSTGCQVINDTPKYKKFMEYTKPQQYFTYCLIDEF